MFGSDKTVVQLRELRPDACRELAGVLCRRPDYGIARPSARWLSRQEEKIEALPKVLLNPGKLKRKWFESISKLENRLGEYLPESIPNTGRVVPPSAVLCPSHERLNCYLIRNIFFAVTKEVSGDYMDALRECPGKNPAVSAFLTRIDSLHAFWVDREVFQKMFGASPHDDRFVRIESNCEACILAAIGANGQILADLYGWLKVRRKHVRDFNRAAKSNGTKREEPVYLHRLVRLWIEHLKKADRDEVRRRGGDISAELIRIWPSVKRDYKKKKKAAGKANGDTYQEIRTNKDGSKKIVQVRGQDHGFNIRLPRTNVESAALQRNMAGLHHVSDARSVYRDGTVIDDEGMYTDSVIADFQRLGIDLQDRAGQANARPGAPASQRDGFANRFAGEVPPPLPNDYLARMEDDDDDDDKEDETYQHEYDERDYAEEAASVLKVQNWYQQQAFNATKTNLSSLDAGSIHPAFATNRSALPEALDIRKDQRVESYQPARKGWQKPERDIDEPVLHSPGADARSEWEDASVYTTADAFESVNLAGAPPMPQIPSQYRYDQRSRRDLPPIDTNSSVPGLSSIPDLYPDRGSSQAFSPQSSRGPREDPFEYDGRKRPSGPDPEPFSRPPPRPPQTKADRRKYLFHDDDSVAASHLTITNKKYLRQNKGRIKEVPVEANPFVRKESKRVKRDDGGDVEMTSPMSPHSRGGSSRGGGYDDGRPRYEGYAALNREAEERARRAASNRYDDEPVRPRSGGSRSNTTYSTGPRYEGYAALNREAEERSARDTRSRDHVYPYSPDTDTPPTSRLGSPRTDQGRGGWGDDASEIRPIDSASNMAWRKDSHATTTLGDFIDSHRSHERRR
ncbi:hypothetical protein PFICI_07462 [Pestalotiopsis fici W106-1]|uniref:Uncharacterized protein n=1 Tax=Pestalotiopsis fici (strain W106-1 / CGMCC3.15140) TaxID=1229662 RepID=W3X1D0_PESFW|nr:uncharacterized protein PFICI_07462 [Pestalotiopsis fici W106-1]ETS79933.1 hypothetical protein PFICI_07462 [Pestalotiopsis fici W106-1]